MTRAQLFVMLACCCILAACRQDREERGADAAPGADSAVAGMHRPAELTAAAEAIIGFLRGTQPFDSTLYADTVALHLSDGGGATSRIVARDALRSPEGWSVGTYSFAPPAGNAELTTRVGRHLNCQESALSGPYARHPHVGTMLRYGESCLQTRNLTLVFDPDRRSPTLIAAVYDQWEW